MQSLSHLTRIEKLRMMNEIWDDLTHDTEPFQSPSWHEDVLKETQQRFANGEVEVLEWEEAKQLLRSNLK
ncbi:MAG: addiction module protein [Methylotenera sp.]|nr:addiction module protein [Methylotenera sp.]MDP3743710.1 addiction module protein [Methylotenera sp.]